MDWRKQMRTVRTAAASLAVVLLVSACSGADAPDQPEQPLAATEAGDATEEAARTIEVTDVRSRMSPRVAGAAAIYLTLTNPAETDDALVAASVSEDVAAAVELHETYEITEEGEGDDAGMHGGGDEGMSDDTGHGDGMSGGDAAPMMGMREIPSIPVPAGGAVELVPGGLHLMVIDLVDDLEVGATYDLVLEFEQAEPITVTVEVREDV
jgi:periplasmic copper chaperone A